MFSHSSQESLSSRYCLENFNPVIYILHSLNVQANCINMKRMNMGTSQSEHAHTDNKKDIDRIEWIQ